MKHTSRITIIIGILLLGMSATLLAQEGNTHEVNFVFKDDVVQELCRYLDTIKSLEQLPESDEEIIQEIIGKHSGDVILFQESDLEYYEKNKESITKRGIDLTTSVLKDSINSKRSQLQQVPTEPENKKSHPVWIWIIIITLIIVLLYVIKSKKKERIINKPTTTNNTNDIVIRRKTTSVLKKQSLEDVVDNEDYMKIDCADFCDDSAVRRMYIKNTCIKDIYNMYAEDLRNPDNPKEDGCMVLGRWVYDQDADEYYVSLEHTVFPGDDAVFSEYELSFGAKIKLNIMTKLRKLRQETQLQYDLTCWVHSHPGIGVFFSNTDYSLHMLHKHPTHPKFLTAIVIDILTPQQELGIFTFKHDMSVNSKAELRKTYSLEEWYKWAIESSRNAFKPEDHFNTMQEVKSRINTCHDILLSNGAIIDMSLLATEQQEGYIGSVLGFINHKSGNNEYVAIEVNASAPRQEHEMIGSFIIVTHCSIPSVRKALSSLFNNIGFVLVYSTADGLLTSIPIVNNELCVDQSFYGEQKLEDLKIWTRRKR